MAKFYVVKEDDCPECGGKGFIQNWFWGQFWLENPTGLEVDEFDSWWAEACGTTEYGDPNIPDEEEPCEECGGTGVFRVEVELSTALKELKLL